MSPTPTRLDAREEHFWIESGRRGLRLFLRRLSAAAPEPSRAPVLYVHGATFPSALSIAHRFDGRSWRDALAEAGLTVWALDFLGFGDSDRYPEMSQPADQNPPLCNAEDAGQQVAAAVRFILEHEGAPRVSIVAHSWGSMPTGRLAGDHPELVERLVLFGPIARRPARRYELAPGGPAWRMITIEDQWKRFVEDVPPGEPPVLLRRQFDEWAERYLDSDGESRSRRPAAVKTPAGPFNDILRAWHGELGYDPGRVQAPVAIIRGGWDGLIPDEDARWLFEAFTASPLKLDIKIGRGTHLMHLELMRGALHAQTSAFLLGQTSHRTDRPESQEEPTMFAVIFEVQPKTERWDDYLGLAKQLKPKLEAIDGFIDNERFGSQRTEGRVLSLSTWRDEKAVVRWRSLGDHHAVQEKGRFEIFEDYHLRVGEITADTAPPKGLAVEEQRFDETEVGAAKACTITEVSPLQGGRAAPAPQTLLSHLQLDPQAAGLLDHEVFDSIYTPGKLLILGSWRDAAAAATWKPEPFEGAGPIRHREVRVIRDYGMSERREAPQYFAEAHPA